jgi:hypothetical protein
MTETETAFADRTTTDVIHESPVDRHQLRFRRSVWLAAVIIAAVIVAGSMWN